MGYRSNVGLVLNEDAYNELKNSIEKIDDNELKMNVLDLLSSWSEQFESKDKSRLFIWNDIKWYSGTPGMSEYKNMDFIEEFLDDLWNNEKSQGSPKFFFIRVGEDLDDVDMRGDFTDNPFSLRLNSSLAYDLEIAKIG